MKKKISLSFFSLCWALGMYAQQTQFSGIVKDDQGLPLPGVSVLIKNTSIGTSTGVNGDFSIEASPGDELVFSFIGMRNEIVTLSEENAVLEIQLSFEQGELEQVVVTALGIKKKEKALGYSVYNLKPKEVSEAKEPNLVNALNGKIAGVQITSGSAGTGSSSRIVIRGESSLNLSNNGPLFVLDGIPMDNQTILSQTENFNQGEMQEVDWGNGAAEINPDDIESMTVLKGGSAAALYGSRGANGVILINTKKAKKNKELEVSVNAGLLFESALRLPQWQNRYGIGWAGEFEYVDGLKSDFGLNDDQDTSWGPEANGQPITQFDSPTKDGKLRAGDIYARGWVRESDGSITQPKANPNDIEPTSFVAYPNNVDDFFEIGTTYTLGTSIGFGSERSTVMMSFGLLENEGIIPNTGLSRKSYRVNTSIDLTDKLEATVYANYIHSSSKNRPSSGYGSESAMYLFTWYGRTINTASLKEYWQRGYEGLEQFNYNYAWHDNPYFMLNENTNAFEKDRLLGNARLNYQFNEDLSFQLRTGLDYYDDVRESKRAYSTQRFKKGAYRLENVEFREINTDFLANYQKDLTPSIGLNANFGMNQMTQQRAYLANFADGLQVPNLYTLNNGILLRRPEQRKEERAINSLYSTLGLSYEDVIFLDITARNDWSSTLPKNNNSYFYPSVSLSAIVSDMIELPSVDFLKFRASWAQIGNDTSPYNLNTPYEYQIPYGSYNTLERGSVISKADLKPEMTTSIEVGADLRLWNNRVQLDVAYYNNQSRDQIMNIPISTTSGFSSQVINAGVVENRGIEALLTLKPIQTDDFDWIASFNFTQNIGEVLELPENLNGVLTLGYHAVYNAEGSKVFLQAREGERLGNMYGKKFKREEGQIVYSQDTVPIVEDELQLLGNYNPDFSLGMNNQFRYKDFSLSFLIDLKYGGEIISRTKQVSSYAGNLAGTEEIRNNYQDIVPDGVKKVGDEYVPLTQADAIGWWNYLKPLYNRGDQQETGIVSATYAKLREVKLGYTLPVDLVGKLGFKNINISLVGRNLWLWTPASNPHFDPETLALQGQNIVPGIEDNSYPSARSYGINAVFNF